jgi:glycogen operon protein
MADAQWGDHGMRCFGMLLDGRAQTTGIRQRGKEATLLVVINEHSDAVKFKLPDSPGGEYWTLLIDTNDPDAKNQATKFHISEEYDITPRSLRLFVLEHIEGEIAPVRQ